MAPRQVRLTLTGTQADALWAAAMLAIDSDWMSRNRSFKEAVILLEDAISASHRRIVTATPDERYL